MSTSPSHPLLHYYSSPSNPDNLLQRGIKWVAQSDFAVEELIRSHCGDSLRQLAEAFVNASSSYIPNYDELSAIEAIVKSRSLDTPQVRSDFETAVRKVYDTHEQLTFYKPTASDSSAVQKIINGIHSPTQPTANFLDAPFANIVSPFAKLFLGDSLDERFSSTLWAENSTLKTWKNVHQHIYGGDTDPFQTELNDLDTEDQAEVKALSVWNCFYSKKFENSEWAYARNAARLSLADGLLPFAAVTAFSTIIATLPKLQRWLTNRSFPTLSRASAWALTPTSALKRTGSTNLFIRNLIPLSKFIGKFLRFPNALATRVLGLHRLFGKIATAWVVFLIGNYALRFLYHKGMAGGWFQGIGFIDATAMGPNEIRDINKRRELCASARTGVRATVSFGNAFQKTIYGVMRNSILSRFRNKTEDVVKTLAAELPTLKTVLNGGSVDEEEALWQALAKILKDPEKTKNLKGEIMDLAKNPEQHSKLLTSVAKLLEDPSKREEAFDLVKNLLRGVLRR